MATKEVDRSNLIVVANNIVKLYGDVRALNQFSIKIRKGEFFGLLGPNGSGKTTSIHVLATLISPSNGEIKIAKYDPSKNPIEIRKKIGLVFQETTVDRSLTLMQNLHFAGQLHGLSKAKINERSKNLLGLFGLEKYVNRPTSQLSGGMRRAVDIIRGIIHEPEILILDEPTIGLDLPNRLKIWKFIEDLRQKSGLTVLLTTHYLEEAEPCDQVAFIESGTIIKQGNPKSLITDLGDYIVEVQAPTATKIIITKLLGEYLDGGGTSYFRCLQKDLNSLTDIQKENKKEIEMWRIRKPNLNDVFLWTTSNNNTEYK